MLVTGAAQRIGRAISVEFASHGYAIVVHHNRSAGEAFALAEEIASMGNIAIPVAMDLSIDYAGTRLLSDAWDLCGGNLAAVINCAAIFDEDDGPGMFSLPSALRHFSINAITPAEITAAYHDRLFREGRSGSVVNIIDQRVMKQSGNLHMSYEMSKSALYTATLAQARAFAPTLRVNGLAPGLTLPSGHLQGDDFFMACTRNPMRRCPSPEEVAEAVVFLATNPALCGTILPVDCGERFVQGSI